jgi:hypothetical protein
MKRLVVMLALLALTGCFPIRGVLSAAAPGLGVVEATSVVKAADEVKSAAFAQGRSDRLAGAFRGRALTDLTMQVGRFQKNNLHLQERGRTATVIFWDSRAKESVLEVTAEHRLVARSQPNPPWAATVRQWWARLDYAKGQWWVVEQEDLPPDKWRSAEPAAVTGSI